MTFHSGSTPAESLIVAVLVPPRPAEIRPDQDDTYIQAREVAACLRHLGHRPQVVDYADHGPATAAVLANAASDVVFNLVEEVPEGPDQLHRVTDLLDRLGYAYTGAGSAALRDTGDKLAMKRRLLAAGLPTPPLLGEALQDARFIVKSVIEHGSLGLDVGSVVTGEAAARALVEAKAKQFGGTWFAESYVAGREIDACLIETPTGLRFLPPGEILFVGYPEGMPHLFHYACKWEDDGCPHGATPRVFPPHEPLFDQIEALSRAAWSLFDLAGCAHIDFRIDASGAPFILEVNANPGLADDAGLMNAMNEAGLTQTDAVAALLDMAVRRQCVSA